LKQINDLLSNIEDRFDKLDKGKGKGESNRDDYSKHYIRKAYSALNSLSDFIDSTTVELYNKPYLFLDGEAGIGKSHLLADISNNRLNENKYSLLLLGQHFTTKEDPRKQILSQLDLSCKRLGRSQILYYRYAAQNADGMMTIQDITSFAKKR
jgi:predicted ATP-dependent serine protease